MRVTLEVRAETHEGLPVNCALSSDFNQKWDVLTDFNKILLFILFHGNLVTVLVLVLTFRQT